MYTPSDAPANRRSPARSRCRTPRSPMPPPDLPDAPQKAPALVPTTKSMHLPSLKQAAYLRAVSAFECGGYAVEERGRVWGASGTSAGGIGERGVRHLE